jgi:predicted DNA-binding transcriptional regulator AlpA
MAEPSKRSIPAPPPPHARYVSRQQVCGFLGVTMAWLKRIRTTDPTFPLPKLISPGSPRWRVVDLEAWAMSKEAAWSKVGGLRPRSFGQDHTSKFPKVESGTSDGAK